MHFHFSEIYVEVEEGKVEHKRNFHIDFDDILVDPPLEEAPTIHRVTFLSNGKPVKSALLTDRHLKEVQIGLFEI